VIRENPGCYGLPTAVSALSPSCRACPVRAGCAHAAFALLELLPDNPLTRRERLSLSVTRTALASTPPGDAGTPTPARVAASPRGVKHLILTPPQLAALAHYPERIASQVRQLLQRGWFDFAKAELRAGRNPADKGWKKVLCAQLLAGPSSRRDLELALVQQLKLSPASARMQASVGLAIFAAGRLASERFGQVALQPN